MRRAAIGGVVAACVLAAIAVRATGADDPLAARRDFDRGDPVRGRAISASCASCHDGDGRTRYKLYPRIAGQNYIYLLNAMKEFRTKERHQAFAFQMWDPALEMTEQDIRDLCAYYAALPW
ncbi:MAG: c-type cytochrome [Burkholderiales bacterium]|nr:c-type cytochrome [Burkholderiales bacterium]